jgi:hypothetical protein
MERARSDEIGAAVEKSRPLDCLIRSVQYIERIIGRRCSPEGTAIARDPA